MQVVVLRTRPVVTVLSQVVSFPDVIDPDETHCDSTNEAMNCFYLRVCFNFNTEVSASNA